MSSLIYAVSSAPLHSKLGHVECPQRVASIVDHLQATGITSKPGIKQITAAGVCQERHLSLVHTEGYVAGVKRVCSQVTEPTLIDDATYITPDSHEAVCQVTLIALWLRCMCFLGGFFVLLAA